MAMFERRLFNKPIAVTKQDMVSGVNFHLPDPYVDPPVTGPTRFFQIPWNKLGYLKRIQIGRGCDGASGCFTFQIWDDYEDEITEVSGYEKRKDITIPDAIAQINWDETEDIPLIGTIYGVPSISGVDVTITARTM